MNKAHSPGPISPGPAEQWSTSDGYYEEVREVWIIPAGSRSKPGAPIGVGAGLWASENVPYRKVGG
jgi:hypothetical protein